MIATNKETGRVVWETNLSDGQSELQFSAAPLAVKDKIILGAAGGDRGVRDFIVALDAAGRRENSDIGTFWKAQPSRRRSNTMTKPKNKTSDHTWVDSRME